MKSWIIVVASAAATLIMVHTVVHIVRLEFQKEARCSGAGGVWSAQMYECLARCPVPIR